MAAHNEQTTNATSISSLDTIFLPCLTRKDKPFFPNTCFQALQLQLTAVKYVVTKGKGEKCNKETY